MLLNEFLKERKKVEDQKETIAQLKIWRHKGGSRQDWIDVNGRSATESDGDL